MATIHAPQFVKEGTGECFIYETDTKERALAAGEQVEFGTLIGVAPKAAAGYKIGRVEAEGADYLCESSYGDGAFVFEGKIYQVTGKDVRIKVSFLQDGTEPQPQKFMVHLPTGLVGGTCDVSIEGGTKLLSDTEVQEGTLLNIIATPTKLYKLAKLDVLGAEQQADGKHKVVGEVFITVRFEKEETPEPPTPNAIENVLLAGISIAPNPFSSLLKIKNDEAINARYELVNTNGMVMRKGFLQGATVLNTEELKAGVYLLRIFSDKTSKTLRVVKE